MSVFQGGSAYNMAQSIADGFVVASELTFKKYQLPDLQTFQFEADRLLREIRGAPSPTDDVQATQARQRKMQRLQQVITLVNAVRQRRR